MNVPYTRDKDNKLARLGRASVYFIPAALLYHFFGEFWGLSFLIVSVILNQGDH